MKRLTTVNFLSAAVAILVVFFGLSVNPVPRLALAQTAQSKSFNDEWAKLIKAAQAEGTIVHVLGGSASRQYRPVIKAFDKKFGVKSIVSTGSGTDQVNRLLAENRAGVYTADVIQIGDAGALRLHAGGGLAPLRPLLIHPSVLDGKKWFRGRLFFADTDTKTFVLNHGAYASPFNLGMRYNIDRVSQADIDSMNSVFDYLDPKWKGKLVAIGALSDQVAGYYTYMVHPDVGEEWVQRWFDPAHGVTFTDNCKLIVDGIAKGKFAFGVSIGSCRRDLDRLIRQGVRAKRMNKPFKEAPTLSGAAAGDNIEFAKNAPHPNAAKLFINWFLSKEGQTLKHQISEGSPDPTLREDVPCTGKVDPRECREPGVKYLYLNADPQFASRRDDAIIKARKIFRKPQKR